jgi:hypothetical protein
VSLWKTHAPPTLPGTLSTAAHVVAGLSRRLSFSVPRGAPPSLRNRTTRARPYGAIDLCSRLWVWLWLSFGVDFPGAHDRWELVRSIESREKNRSFFLAGSKYSPD